MAPLTASGVSDPFDRPTIVYVFSTSCEWCRRDRPNVLALALSVKDDYRIIGITLEADDVARDRALAAEPFPGVVFKVMVGDLPPETAAKFRATPQLIVLRKDRVVERAWVGALMDERRKDVESFFGVSLPGMAVGNGRD